MPLDRVGKEYAAMLYQNAQESILADRAQELQNVATDFGRRNMVQSGMYLSARAKVIGKHAGSMAEARARTLLQAYEMAGQALDQTTLQEIYGEVDQLCEAQKRHFRQAARKMVSHHFSAPPRSKPEGLVDTLAQEMEIELDRVAAKVKRDLAIKHHEILLDGGRAALKGNAAAIGTQWDVFISHASEDKLDFVHPLARALEKTGLKVWFDATALTVGDSLRRKIDEGLAHSRYGVVVLSPNFFAKPWPQEELDGLVSKEVSGTKVILPVWHNIDLEGVRARSPMLAGRLAARSSDGMEKVVSDLRKAMRV
jgi:hypothetical protein